MNSTKKKSPAEQKKALNDAAQTMTGVAKNIADNQRVSSALEKDRTKVLNNNPRNNETNR